MARVKPEDKAVLIERGLWPAFTEYRTKLRESGVSGARALRMSLAEFLREPAGDDGDARDAEPEEIDGLGLDAPAGGGEASEKETPPVGGEYCAPGRIAKNPAKLITDRKAKRAASEAAVGRVAIGGSLNAAVQNLQKANAAEFEGKVASEVEIIRWVARNMYLDGVTAEDCPDATAWGLLTACRRSPGMESDFWRSMYTKIVPNKTQLEDVEEVMDGMAMIEVIEKMRAASMRAKEGVVAAIMEKNAKAPEAVKA